jgi:hypothetical protein
MQRIFLLRVGLAEALASIFRRKECKHEFENREFSPELSANKINFANELFMHFS